MGRRESFPCQTAPQPLKRQQEQPLIPSNAGVVHSRLVSLLQTSRFIPQDFKLFPTEVCVLNTEKELKTSHNHRALGNSLAFSSLMHMVTFH